MKLKVVFFICLGIVNSYSQKTPKTNIDSLYQVALKEVSTEKRNVFVRFYNGNDLKGKESLLNDIINSRGGKAVLKENLEKNFSSIETLKDEFAKLIPQDYFVSIKYRPKTKYSNDEESFDITIVKDKRKEKMEIVCSAYNFTVKSKEVYELFKILRWDFTTLNKIKQLLNDANCISIDNDPNVKMVFLSEILGEFSYLFLKNDLAESEIAKFNNPCYYSIYTKNIVLQYASTGDFSPDCFPESK